MSSALKYVGIIGLSASLVLCASCKKEETNVVTGTESTVVIDTSTVSTTTDTTMTSTSSSTDTTMSSMTSTGTASLTSLTDGRFAEEAANGGLAEVQLGTLAATKAESADVKTFAQQMVTDHTKANSEFAALLGQKGSSAPADVDKEHKAVVTKLSALSGAAFDKAYMKAMVDDHKKVIGLFETESKSGKDADMKSWAEKTLPTLKQHQTMAKETAAKVGVK